MDRSRKMSKPQIHHEYNTNLGRNLSDLDNERRIWVASNGYEQWTLPKSKSRIFKHMASSWVWAADVDEVAVVSEETVGKVRTNKSNLRVAEQWCEQSLKSKSGTQVRWVSSRYGALVESFKSEQRDDDGTAGRSFEQLNDGVRMATGATVLAVLGRSAKDGC